MPVIPAKSAELVDQLGEELDGVISSDDYSVYNGYVVTAQQKCLAHLRRHFKKVVSLRHGNNPVLGQVFLDLIDEANVCASVLARNPRRDRLPKLGGVFQGTDKPGYRAMDWSSWRLGGKLLRALTGKPPWGIATGQS